MVAQPNFETEKPEAKKHVTAAEYLQFERAHERKHELFNGEIVARPDVSARHVLIMGNIGVNISMAVGSHNYRVHMSMLRLKVSKTGDYLYPDVSVVYGKPQLEDEHQDTLLNPMIIAEVISPATEAYDRGAKFQSYRALDSLQEYLLVEQDSPYIEHYARRADGTWVLTTVNGLDKQLSLPALGVQLALSDVYINVDFTPTEERNSEE